MTIKEMVASGKVRVGLRSRIGIIAINSFYLSRILPNRANYATIIIR